MKSSYRFKSYCDILNRLLSLTPASYGAIQYQAVTCIGLYPIPAQVISADPIPAFLIPGYISYQPVPYIPYQLKSYRPITHTPLSHDAPTSACPLNTPFPIPVYTIYSQTSLVRASLIRISHNPNPLPSTLFYHFLFTMIQ